MSAQARAMSHAGWETRLLLRNGEQLLLTLGIPGSPTAAVLLGGLLIWGLQPGPMLFVEQKDFVWGLIASMYLGNIVGLLVVLTMVPIFAPCSRCWAMPTFRQHRSIPTSRHRALSRRSRISTPCPARRPQPRQSLVSAPRLR